MSSIISFYGADHKTGTSMISLCVAQSIARMCPSLKVLLIYIESKSSEAYTPKIGESINRIWPYVNEQILDLEELEQKAKYEKNLSIIGGPGFADLDESFNEDGCQYLFSRCSDKYDIIICDTGSEITKALCLGSIRASDEVNIVLNQKENSLRKYEKESAFYEKMGISFSYYIINMYDKDNIYSKNYIIKRLDLSDEKTICIRDSGFGDIAEMQSKSLLEFKSTSFKRCIENMAKRIIADYGQV